MYNVLIFLIGGLVAFVVYTVFFALAFPQLSSAFFTYLAEVLDKIIKRKD